MNNISVMLSAPGLQQTAEGGNGFLCDAPFLEGPQILIGPAQMEKTLHC